LIPEANIGDHVAQVPWLAPAGRPAGPLQLVIHQIDRLVAGQEMDLR
jgi:hypothetical protein